MKVKVKKPEENSNKTKEFIKDAYKNTGRGQGLVKAASYIKRKRQEKEIKSFNPVNRMPQIEKDIHERIDKQERRKNNDKKNK